MPRGLILQPTYRVREGVPVIQLFGRLEEGPAFLVEENRYRPYFFVPAERAERVEPLAAEYGARCEPTELRDLRGESVCRVSVDVPGQVAALRDRLIGQGIATFEGDIRFPYRFLIDRNIRAACAIDGEADVQPGGLHVFHNPELRPADVRPSLGVLSLDLETTPDASHILSAALVSTVVNPAKSSGEKVAEVHLVRAVARDACDACDGFDGRRVVIHADERALIEALLQRIRSLDPDVLVGWNVIGFDLHVIAKRCAALGLRCELGRVPGDLAFRQDASFSRDERVELPGRMVLDGIPLVRDAIRLEDYRLETVGQAVLGRGKRIDHDVPDAGEEIQRLAREDPVALIDYNLEDAQLVVDILEKEGLLDLALERSLLSGMQLDRVGASIASFDLVYLPELRLAGVVAPSVDRERKNAPVRGGAVLDSVPGLFRNVAVFDFKSLYPSLIRTYQLDPLAHARADEDAIVAPNGARFAREGAILPRVIERFAERREAAKARGDRNADQAIKIMMNSLFGVLGSASCRFFDPDIANAITGFGQETLAFTRDLFEELGVRVLYGDTDSVFVELPLGAVDDPARATEVAAELREAVERQVSGRIRSEHGTESLLTLELERVYERFFMPRVRGRQGGSKKRYAGWIDGALDIVGLEAVRRDWPALARILQEGLLERLFRDQEALPFARELAERLRAGELDAQLVYTKRIRKGSLDRYTASTPPHVQAARKLAERGGRVDRSIRYVVTGRGPEPVVHGRPLPDGIDRRHYLEKVMRPVADAILLEIDQSFDDALGAPKQLSLL